MDRTRLDDMLARYGEVCTQKVAAQLLNVVPRTIHRMLEEGRLRRVDRRVDVRSICEYIENPKQANFVAKAKNTRPRNTMSERFLCRGPAGQMGTPALRGCPHGKKDTLRQVSRQGDHWLRSGRQADL